MLGGADRVLEVRQEARVQNADVTPESGSVDALFGAVYDRLKRMAGKRLSSRGNAGTLDTTALVHELYLRVNAQGDLHFSHPSQFFTYAARAMRHVLADRARERLTKQAGGGWLQITLTGSDERLAIDSAEEAIALDAALRRLEAVDARAARVVELRYFAGLTSEQTADALGVARRTAHRDWEFAQAFLKTDLG
jgi:RNA polymerase sigma factor (TIGR02999 family)